MVGLATDDGRGLSKTLKSSLARVTETVMPGCLGGSSHQCIGTGGGHRQLQGVEGSLAVTSKEGVLGMQILHRNTKRVKFN
jgi:hypothetical protein